MTKHIDVNSFDRVKDLRYRLYRKKSGTYEWDDDLPDQIEQMEGFDGWENFGSGGTWDVLWIGVNGRKRILITPVRLVSGDAIDRNLINDYWDEFKNVETYQQYLDAVARILGRNKRVDNKTSIDYLAKQAISRIKQIDSLEELHGFITDEERKTVKQAFYDKVREFSEDASTDI